MKQLISLIKNKKPQPISITNGHQILFIPPKQWGNKCDFQLCLNVNAKMDKRSSEEREFHNQGATMEKIIPHHYAAAPSHVLHKSQDLGQQILGEGVPHGTWAQSS